MLTRNHLGLLLPRRKQETDAAREARLRPVKLFTVVWSGILSILFILSIIILSVRACGSRRAAHDALRIMNKDWNRPSCLLRQVTRHMMAWAKFPQGRTLDPTARFRDRTAWMKRTPSGRPDRGWHLASEKEPRPFRVRVHHGHG